MNYITPSEAARKWNVNLRTVQGYCSGDKIPGAVRRGRQWFIPDDAPRPDDGRTSSAAKGHTVEVYHFPVFVYTRYYLAASELSEDERSLLEAQLLNLRCEYPKSARICKKLISESFSPSVRFGAWLTNAINFMFLGLSSELPSCVNALNSICENETAHREDYRLLLAFYDQTYRCDPARYLSIDVSMLSPDAMLTYRLTAFVATLFSVDDIPENSIRFFEAACRETDLLGIAPAGLTMHGVLAMLHSRRGNMAAKLHHMDEACRIGYETGLVRLLAKCSSLAIDSYAQCLSKYGEAFASGIRDICLRNRNKWQLAFKAHSDSNPFLDLSIFEHEILLLLAYRTSMRDIAVLKNITEKDLRKVIGDLCGRLSVASKKELIELYKNTFLFDSKDRPTGKDR